MSDYNKRWEDRKQRWENRMHRRQGGRVWTGIFILFIGLAALLKATFTDFPDWVFSWQMLLIAIGFFIGLRHNFRDTTGMILILIGGVFLINDLYPEFTFRRYLWPLALIIVGLFIILRPRRSSVWRDWKSSSTDSAESASSDNINYSKDDFVESTSIFGGSKKNIISKNFRGGDLVNIFGGSELDLMQADFTGTAIIELTTIFGGTKLLVPSNWSVKSEAVTIFGGMEDKRKMQAIQETPDKILLLRGTVIFGGIEVKSY